MTSTIRFVLRSTTALAVFATAGAAFGAAPLGTTQALLRLNGGLAHHKAPQALLERLLAQPSNDILVEYVTEEPARNLAAPASEGRVQESLRHAGFASIKASVTQAVPDIQTLKTYDALPMAFVRASNREALVKLLEHRQVKAIYPNDPQESFLNESLPEIGFYEAMVWGPQFKGNGGTVAVLDTGVDYTQAVFGQCTAPGVPAGCRIAAAVDIAEDDGVRDDSAHPHGTWVSTIVAAVAPQARLVNLDVFTGRSVYPADVVTAIDWVIQHRSQYNIVSVNMSFGKHEKRTTECANSYAAEPFRRLREANILPVVATGNHGWTDGMAEPACAPGAVRVSSTYDGDVGPRTFNRSGGLGTCTDATTAAGKVLCSSNAGSTLVAPGAMLFGTGGTSFAAPHVAGAIAVLRAPGAVGTDTIADTVFRLRSSAWHGTDHRSGKTVFALDLGEAVKSIVQGLPPIH